MNLKYLSILGYLLIALALIGLLLNHSFLGNNFIAIMLQVLGIVLGLWARITFGLRSFHLAANPTKGGLVTTGPYRYIRHPIYTAVLLLIWPAVLSHLSIINCLLGIIGTLALLFRVAAEERLVLTYYPEYIEYSKRTKRFIPYIL